MGVDRDIAHSYHRCPQVALALSLLLQLLAVVRD